MINVGVWYISTTFCNILLISVWEKIMNKLWCGQISDNKVLNQFLLLLTHCLIMSYIVSYLMRVNSLSNRELTKYEQVLKAESKAKQKYSAFMLTKSIPIFWKQQNFMFYPFTFICTLWLWSCWCFRMGDGTDLSTHDMCVQMISWYFKATHASVPWNQMFIKKTVLVMICLWLLKVSF